MRLLRYWPIIIMVLITIGLATYFLVPVETMLLDKKSTEVVLWNKIQISTAAEPFQDYLSQYPEGRFVALANMRLKQLSQPVAEFQDALKVGGEEPVMIIIPAGEFIMGSPASEMNRDFDEEQHKVLLEKRFALSRYELTVSEFRQFVDVTNYQTEAEETDGCWGINQDGKFARGTEYSWKNPGFDQKDNYPVSCVSWRDGVAYTQWLSKQTGQNYRLPTEAEWEYAARAGTTTAYWWINGSRSGEQGNCGGYCPDQWQYSSPAGSFKPNPWGLYDTAGNVWEWTCSQYESSYSGMEYLCVSGTPDSRLVSRGGGWDVPEPFLRSARRNSFRPTHRRASLGLRIARLIAI